MEKLYRKDKGHDNHKSQGCGYFWWGESAKMGNRVTVGVLRKGFWNSGNILILDLGDD